MRHLKLMVVVEVHIWGRIYSHVPPIQNKKKPLGTYPKHICGLWIDKIRKNSSFIPPSSYLIVRLHRCYSELEHLFPPTRIDLILFLYVSYNKIQKFTPQKSIYVYIMLVSWMVCICKVIIHSNSQAYIFFPLPF